MLRTRLSTNSRALSVLLQKRLIHSTQYAQAATIFRMPAMSPTMEEGGIVKWHFKEGESFNSGDSLLEVETDKATIDVEASDDGIMAKILLQDGSKGIPVNKPIAITAEPGDDLATLELPNIEEDQPLALAPSTPAPKPQETPKPSPKKPLALSLGKKANPDQKFFPSVEILIHENGISREDALAKIESSAPQGRITKGDVLAYLGKISKDSVNSIASYIESHKHLDLSNIELKKPEEPKADTKDAKTDKTTSKTLAKPEPIKVSKSFILSQSIPHEKLSLIANRAAKLAEQYAYSSSLYLPSDLIDPLFEDIISPPKNTDRFKISVKINEPTNTKLLSRSVSAFDDLLGLSPVVLLPASTVALPSVDVDLVLNGKVVDSKQRAQLFIEKFGELLTVPDEKKVVEEFEF